MKRGFRMILGQKRVGTCRMVAVVAFSLALAFPAMAWAVEGKTSDMPDDSANAASVLDAAKAIPSGEDSHVGEPLTIPSEATPVPPAIDADAKSESGQPAAHFDTEVGAVAPSSIEPTVNSEAAASKPAVAASEPPSEPSRSSSDQQTPAADPAPKAAETSHVDPKAQLKAAEDDSVKLSQGVYGIAPETAPGKRVEVGGGSRENAAPAQVYENNYTRAQRWRLAEAGGGFYTIQNVNSGLMLDVAGADVASGNVIQYEANGTKAQLWTLEAVGDAFKVRSALSSVHVLGIAQAKAANGAKLRLVKDGTAGAVAWKMEEHAPALPDGMYTVKSQASGKMADAAGSGIGDATNVWQWEGNGTIAQTFDIRYQKSSGYYRVYSAASGLALDVWGAQDEDGANVQLYSGNGTYAQDWAIVSQSDGSYALHSATGGRALDVRGADTASGANIQLYRWNGTAAQKWEFAPVESWLPDGVYSIATALDTDRALAVRGGSISANANVETAARLSNDWAQKWIVKRDTATGAYRVRDLNSRLVLAVAGSAKAQANVEQAKEGQGATQLWIPTLTVHGIRFASAANTKVVLDVYGASTAVGANVWLYDDNGTRAQKFRLKAIDPIEGAGAYIITSAKDGRAVTVSGGSTADGAALVMAKNVSSAEQKFRISGSSTACRLQNAKSGKYIDAANTARIVQTGGASGPSKQWKVAVDLESGCVHIDSVSARTRLDASTSPLALAKANGSVEQSFLLTPTTTFKYYLNPGHGWNDYDNGSYDTGAVGSGYCEAELASELAKMVEAYCADYGLEIVNGEPFELPYWERLPKAVSLGCDAIVSIHFDYGAGAGDGTSTMVGTHGKAPGSDLLNDVIHEKLVAALGLRDIGTTHRSDITCVNGSIPSMLMEVAFMDNESNISRYLSRKDEVARAIAEGMYEASLELV